MQPYARRKLALLSGELVGGLPQQGRHRPVLHHAEQAQLAVHRLGKVAGDRDAARAPVRGGPSLGEVLGAAAWISAAALL